MSHLVVSGILDISHIVVANTVATYVSFPLSADSMTITKNMSSTSIQTGALQISHGGLGANGDSYVGGNLSIHQSATLSGDLNCAAVSVVGTVNNEEGTLSIGSVSMNLLTLSQNTTASSYQNIDMNTNSGNAWFGQGALSTYANNGTNTEHNNTALGISALGSLNDGMNNTVIGLSSMPLNIAGNDNTAVGTNVLIQTSNSNTNTAVGFQTMNVLSLQDASYNVAVGCNSMQTALSSFQNTCVGTNTCGHDDTGAFGTMTAIGAYAGLTDYQGVNNTYMGAFADTLGTYTNSTAIGYGSQISDNHQIVLGTAAEYVQIQGSLRIQGDVDVSGNVSVGPVGQIYGNVQPFSDARLKEEAMPLPPVLPIFPLLRPRRFRWKETQKEDIGFLAQEFYETIGQDVWPTDMIHTAPNGYLTLDYAKMVVVLTKAVQELTEEYEALKQEAEGLTSLL